MLDNIAELHKLCFPNKPWSESDFADLKKSGCEIIASQNSFIVWRQVLDEAEIITVGVHPQARSGGIGTALLTIMENEVRKKNGKKIFLEVAENNLPARSLYEKNGYVKVGLRPKYYDGIDAIMMEKVL